jgi:hypothetical protein
MLGQSLKYLEGSQQNDAGVDPEKRVFSFFSSSPPIVGGVAIAVSCFILQITASPILSTFSPLL